MTHPGGIVRANMRAGAWSLCWRCVFMVRVGEVGRWWMEDGAATVSVSGSWLKDFGFEMGRKVVVEVTQGIIVIKLVDAED